MSCCWTVWVSVSWVWVISGLFILQCVSVFSSNKLFSVSVLLHSHCLCFQTDADPEVCKRMCKSNNYENVLSLVSYYQMVMCSLLLLFYIVDNHFSITLVHQWSSSCKCVILRCLVCLLADLWLVLLRAAWFSLSVGLHAGAPRVSAAAAAQSVWSDVQSGRGAHLHSAELHPAHGAGQRPADGHTGWGTLRILTCVASYLESFHIGRSVTGIHFAGR